MSMISLSNRNIRIVVIGICSVFLILSCSTGTKPLQKLTISTSPTDGGSVSPAKGQFDKGTKVKLKAESNKHWVFDKWQGGITGSENPTTITMGSDKNVTAIFKKREYPLTATTEGEGIISEEVVQSKSKDYQHGTVVKLTAKPDDGWQFAKWKGDLEGSENPKEVTVEGETSVTAVFEQREVNIEKVSESNLYGTPGTSLQSPFVVKTVDQDGDVMSDILIEYSVTKGGGSISPREVRTNSKGLAKATLTLAENMDKTVVEAKTKDLPSSLDDQVVEFTAIPEMQLDQWLSDHSKIMDAINWETPNKVINYRDWSEQQKSDLNKMYLRVVNSNTNLKNYPPENLYSPTENPDHRRVETYLSEENAWNLYLMNIANSIAVERNNVVNWSILSSEYSQEELKMLLDGRSYFFYNEEVSNDTPVYEPVSVNFSSRVLPSQPQMAMDFFKSEGILASSRLETIYRLIDWSAVNLRHFTGGWQLGNAEDHWHYRGAVPVDRIIKGTDRKGDETDEVYHLTAGCHGTNHFYVSVLRNLNIPVQYERKGGHATPYFTMSNLYMSHGDDPYSAYYARKPAIHPQKLLIDEQTYSDWFSYTENTRDEIRNNIGRQSLELGVENLSHYLLQLYCGDKQDDLSKQEGRVFDSLSHQYTMEELKEMNLWKKMDDKLSSIGGCENISRERVPYY